MSLFEVFLLALALSMDAFAVSICAGLKGRAIGAGSAIIVGLYFGTAQALMPVIGFFLAASFADYINAYGNIIAFALLAFIGGKMIWESFSGGDECKIVPTSPAKMLPFAVATSIDAMAVGVSFAFFTVNVFLAALIIGTTTFTLSIAGVKIGSVFGSKFKSKAEFAGGAVLILMGLNILIS